jgi:flagellar biosynthesis/type III secretory pathway chaperone
MADAIENRPVQRPAAAYQPVVDQTQEFMARITNKLDKLEQMVRLLCDVIIESQQRDFSARLNTIEQGIRFLAEQLRDTNLRMDASIRQAQLTNQILTQAYVEVQSSLSTILTQLSRERAQFPIGPHS